MAVNWIPAGSAVGAAFARARPLTSSQVTKGVVSRAVEPVQVKDALTGLRTELQKTLGTASPTRAAPRPVYATRDLYEDGVVVGTHEILIGFEKSGPVEPARVAKDEIAKVTAAISGLQEGLAAPPAQGGQQLSIELAGIVQKLALNRLAIQSSAAGIAQAIDQVDRALARLEPLQMKLEKQKQPAAVEPASYGLGDLDAHLDPPHSADAALALTRSVADRLRGIGGPTGLGGRAGNSVFSIKT